MDGPVGKGRLRREDFCLRSISLDAAAEDLKLTALLEGSVKPPAGTMRRLDIV